MLDLVHRLNVDEGKTVAMVLHDVNKAARVSDHVIAIRDGQIVAQGSPADVIHPDVLSRVFAMATEVVPHPATGAPICIPRGANPILETVRLAVPQVASASATRRWAMTGTSWRNSSASTSRTAPSPPSSVRMRAASRRC